MIRKFLTVSAAITAAVGGNAQAEVYEITTIYPASDNVAQQIRSIEIERFNGDGGKELERRLEAKLTGIQIDGERYFEIIPYRSREDADALLLGSADVDVEEEDTEATRRRCVERDADDKCLDRKNIEVPCITKTIVVDATVRFTALAKGGGRFNRDYTPKFTQTVCEKDDGSYERFSREDRETDKLIEGIANDIRVRLAPDQRRQRIRLLESRKGLSKEEGKAFKAAVKTTKRDQTRSCEMFTTLEQDGAANISLTFNSGLCAEKTGDLDRAQEIYYSAEDRFGRKSEVTEAIKRIAAHKQALADLDDRRNYFSEN